MEVYARKFQDAGYYRSSPCFGPQGCSAAERAWMEESATAGSAAQKTANDAMLRGLDQQQEQIEVDARQLETLQTAAGTVNGEGRNGQLAALQAANMLASHQAAQLLQLRALLAQQQQAEAVRAQAAADREAREQAGHAQAYRHTINLVPGREWRIE